MDQELVELLSRVGDEDNPLTDEELAELQEKVVAIAQSVDPNKLTDEDLQVLTEAKDAKEAISAEITKRAEEAAERNAKATELLDAIVPKDETPAEEVAQPDEDDKPETPETDVPVNPGETPSPDGVVEGKVEEEVVAVAASAAPKLPSVSALARRRPVSHKPVETQTESRKSLIAAADIPGVGAGQQVDVERWAQAVTNKLRALTASGLSPNGNGDKIYFGEVRYDYPEDRQLSGDDEITNTEKMEAVTSEAALIAAGGICGPVDADYNVAGVSVADRPVRSALAQFQATRGGIRYVLPFKLSDIAAAPAASNAVGVWTNANDLSPSSPTTKPHATYTCQTVQEATVDAITSIVQFGNFQARYFQEQLANFLETIAAQHARVAESTLLASIATGSRAVTAGINLLGISRDLLAEIDRAGAGVRYRNRMSPNAPLRLLLPDWVRQAIKADLARQAPGDSGGGTERLATSDAEIEAMFRARNVNVSFYIDNPTGAAVSQGFPVQGAGMLVPWPTKAIMYLYPEGSWTFLDGGTLDLGMVRDSTLNQTNDVQMFSESFEKAVFRGVESLQITADTCVNGAAAALVDTTSLCTSGS